MSCRHAAVFASLSLVFVSAMSARAEGPSLRDAPAQDVVVRGKSQAERVRESAMAVHVIETKEAKRETADLGEVLARNEGVSVQRGGGLGSTMRFSLNGLTDDQVRFFLDGIPLDLAGYPLGLANVPVNLVQRVEVYRGVVPIRFGADALGGAVNLVSDVDTRPDTHGAISYQGGSFGTSRMTLGLQTHDVPTGIFTRVNAFYDHADNDFPIQVQTADATGALTTSRVHRFHDAYTAGGFNVESGFVKQPWARRLMVRLFLTSYGQEIQNNPFGKVPYGEPSFDRFAAGASVRYEHVLAHRFPVDVVAGYTYGQTNFVDVGACVYDWFGRCQRPRPQLGEIEAAKPHDIRIWDKTSYARANLGWSIARGQTLRLAIAPTYTARLGDERRALDPSARDPLNGRRSLLTVVTGLEETSELFDRRFENILFAKSYTQTVHADDIQAGSGNTIPRDHDTHQFGAGDSLRFRFTPWLYGKLSYEYATRLPSMTETFGDGVLIDQSPELGPETSHNGNIGATLDLRRTGIGDFRADANVFLRSARDLIVLTGQERRFIYQNVFRARAAGIESSAGWTSPGEYVVLDGNLTVLDFRNTERAGIFAKFEGDRIPNRPYFFANGSARFQLHQVASANDELALSWHTRYVHSFARGWDSIGNGGEKQFVDAQLVHSLALTYVARGELVTLGFTGEAQNITDERTFDFFGVQRPGRAFYFKTTLEF